jgi:peptide/nickel transport system substrate-binding protein
MYKKHLSLIIGLLVIASMVLAACQPAAAPTAAPAQPEAPVVTEAPVEPTAVPVEPTAAPVEPTAVPEEPTAVPEPEPEPTTRRGGWLDEVVFSVVDNTSAVTQIEAGAIDIYASGLSSKDLPAIEEAGLNFSKQNGLYYELTFNPVGPEFPVTGKLNPFSSSKVREAMNWLLDREYINQEVFAGGALAKFFALTTQFPDYADQAQKVRELEAKYAFNPEKANEQITAEMEAMGATLVDGKWTYNDEPVTIILLIRSDSDGTRVPIGDYVANQLESIGFTTDRQYKTSSEASPIWVGGNPEDGLFHIYTGAWSATVIDRDQGDNFQFFDTPASAYGFTALWQAKQPSEEYDTLADALAYNKFTSLEERATAMARALELQLEESHTVWLIDGKNFAPFRDGVEVTYDLAAGIDGAMIWPYTLRFTDEEGGQMKWGQPDLFVDPWNPLAGSNWAFDASAQRGTTTAAGVMYDPHTGLVHPLRIESASVVAQEGLPVGQTLDWLTLEFAPEIAVPEDAWSDWNATDQVFITAGEKFPDGVTAKIKSTVVYPADLWDTVKYHDGSLITMGDFIYSLIMTFDPGKPESAIYDEAIAANTDAFLENFKGVKILSTDPLTIEFYTDVWALDAELNVTTMFPTYTYGEAPWHSMAVAALADENGELAFSADKADANEIEWTNFIGGPSLEIMAKFLDQAEAESYIPFAATLGEYITAEEAVARYANLKQWYADHGHFWVGTGPYYLDKAFTTEKTATLKQFADHPDLSDRWAVYGEPKVAEVEVDGAGQATLGSEFTFDVFVTFNGEPYVGDEIKQVKAMLYDATGQIVYVTEGELVADGQYLVTIPADITGALEAGASKMEVAVVPFTVSIPTFSAFEFVTIP